MNTRALSRRLDSIARRFRTSPAVLREILERRADGRAELLDQYPPAAVDVGLALAAFVDAARDSAEGDPDAVLLRGDEDAEA